MSNKSVADSIRRMEHWGYILTDRPHPDSPGYGRLLVAIRRVPTQEHYDPEAIHLQLCESHGSVVRTSLHLDSPMREPSKVCPGRIELTDRVDKRRGFFCYGGAIDAENVPDETVFDLTSSAPILELTDSLAEETSDQLVSETEALWAKIRVQWGADDSGFMRSLSSLEPLALYAATVMSLWDKYNGSRMLRQTFPEFYAVLRHELAWIETLGMSPGTAKGLDEVLCSG